MCQMLREFTPKNQRLHQNSAARISETLQVVSGLLSSAFVQASCVLVLLAALHAVHLNLELAQP